MYKKMPQVRAPGLAKWCAGWVSTPNSVLSLLPLCSVYLIQLYTVILFRISPTIFSSLHPNNPWLTSTKENICLSENCWSKTSSAWVCSIQGTECNFPSSVHGAGAEFSQCVNGACDQPLLSLTSGGSESKAGWYPNGGDHIFWTRYQLLKNWGIEGRPGDIGGCQNIGISKLCWWVLAVFLNQVTWEPFKNINKPMLHPQRLWSGQG